MMAPAALAASKAPLLDVVVASGADFPPSVFALIALFAICNTALINLIMASRLLYGMANEKIVPPIFARVHPTRKTPYVAILFSVAIAGSLILIGKDVGVLASTCTFLLLLVFGIVNVAVLVLRRRPVDHPHFHAPTWAPVLGAIGTVALATPLADRDWQIYALGGGLIALGAVLWVVQRLVGGKRTGELDVENLIK
jgi:amino acid transporter